MSDRHIILYHNPQSRAVGAQTLLEELGADYELKELDFQKNEQKSPEFLALNPMGKIPTIVHNGAVVTEQPAVFAYLADLYPEANLAPPIGDPQRGPYLRWLAFYGSSFEPALIDRAVKRDPGKPSMNPYGDYETVISTFTAQIEKGPYLLGERISAADILWGVALEWVTMFGLVEATPPIKAYIERIVTRPASARIKKVNEELLKAKG